MTEGEILDALKTERERQTELWDHDHPWGYGDCADPRVPMIVKAAVLMEEVGEFTQAVLDAGPDKAPHDPAARTEALQVLAVVHAILEGM